MLTAPVENSQIYMRKDMELGYFPEVTNCEFEKGASDDVLESTLDGDGSIGAKMYARFNYLSGWA